MVASVGCRGGRSRRGCRARTSPSLPTRSWIPARTRVAHGSTPGSLVRLHLHSPQSLTASEHGILMPLKVSHFGQILARSKR